MLNPSPVTELPGALHVATLAGHANVTAATVRYYSRIGLLRPGRDPENGYRCFVAADLRRVIFIRRAQLLGLTISDIKAILETVDHGKSPCRQVELLVRQRLASISSQIANLRDTEVRISKALKSWNDMDDQTRNSGELCPLIESVGNVSDGEN